MNIKEVKVYSPASIANLVCGFDIFGIALNEPVDEIILRKSHNPGVQITNINGADFNYGKNIVVIVLETILHHLPNNKYGIEVEIYKNIKPGSGIGSSAASSAGAAVGANLLFGNCFNPIETIQFAIEGERVACDIGHADNVASVILGGLTLVRSSFPLDILSLPFLEDLWVTIIHPHSEVKTFYARKMLKENILFSDAIRQWGNVGALISAIYRTDYCLIGRSLEDFIVEPLRYAMIPAFDTLKIECLKVGALGGGISGSGPSFFMISKGRYIANRVAERMFETYNKLGIPYRIYISNVNINGVKYSFTI